MRKIMKTMTDKMDFLGQTVEASECGLFIRDTENRLQRYDCIVRENYGLKTECIQNGDKVEIWMGVFEWEPGDVQKLQKLNEMKKLAVCFM